MRMQCFVSQTCNTDSSTKGLFTVSRLNWTCWEFRTASSVQCYRWEKALR